MEDDATPVEIMPIKVVFMGSCGVGKTSMIQTYLTDQFTLNTQSTIGAMYFSKKVQRGDTIYDLHIWDTAGQERYKSMVSLYYKDAQACIVVCDVTDASSYSDLNNWITDLKEQAQVADLSTLLPKFITSIPSKSTLQRLHSISLS